MCSNKLLDKKVITQPLQEPVTLTEAKAWMNVDYDEKDNIISSLITAARHLLEEKYDIGIMSKQVQVVIDNSCGGMELPGYPSSEITATDRDGNEVQLTVTGESVVYIDSPCDCYLKVTYTSGYDLGEVPDVYKTAIKEQVLWMFENLGDVQTVNTICPVAEMSLMPYKRNGFGVFI